MVKKNNRSTGKHRYQNTAEAYAAIDRMVGKLQKKDVVPSNKNLLACGFGNGTIIAWRKKAPALESCRKTKKDAAAPVPVPVVPAPLPSDPYSEEN